jgi:DNA-binding XRE family transcriptional regulator
MIEITDNPNLILVDGQPRKCCIRSKSFPYLCVKIDRKLKSVHRLIAEQYIPNPNGYRIVNHLNGNKLDNRIENLEWASYSMNAIHKYQSLNYKHKVESKRILTKEIADEIKMIYSSRKISQQKLANLYTVSRGTIQQIIENKSYHR